MKFNNKILIFIILILNLAFSQVGISDTLDTLITLELDVNLEDSSESINSEDTLVEISKMPELIKSVEPDYPKEVYSKGIVGKVLINLIVNDSGHVDSVWLAQGVNPILDSNVLSVAKDFIFSPAILENGDSVAVMLQYEKEFKLEDVKIKVDKYVNYTGRLLEKGTRAPITDAMVILTFLDTTFDTTLIVPFSNYLKKIALFNGQYLEEGHLVTLTDSLGRFTFTSLPAGDIQITSPLSNYEQFKEREKIEYAVAIDVDYRIRKTSYSEYEIIVYGKDDKKEVSKRTLTLSEIKRIPGFGGDAVKVVQTLPGVARPTFGMAQIIVRGANTDDSRFFLDGIEIPQLFHFGGVKSTYNSDLLKSVDFYPGGFGVRYGGAVAGIIELTGRKAKTDRFHGYVDLNFFDGSLLLEGPLTDKISFTGEFRRSFIGDIIKFVAKSFPSTTIMTTAPSYWDYVGRIDYAINKKNRAYITLFGAKDVMELVSSSVRGGNADIDAATNSFYMESLFHMGIFGFDTEFSERIKNSFRYSLLYGSSEFSIFGKAKMKTQYYQHTFRDDIKIRLFEKLKMTIGTDIQFFPLDIDLTIGTGTNIVDNSQLKDWYFGVMGGYLDLEWMPNDKVTIIPGIRYDYFPELKYNGAIIPEFWDYNIKNEGHFSGEPSFRINGKYQFLEKHLIKGAIGNYSQSPKPMGLTIHPTWGNPTLPSTRAAQYVLGYEWQITDLIHLDLEGYYNRQWSVPYEITDDLHYTSNGKKRMKGLELMLKHDQGERFFGWISYSLSHSELWNNESNGWDLFEKDQTHNLIAVGSFKLPKNWETGFRMQYTTGDPQTRDSSVVNDIDNFAWDVSKKSTNSDRLDPTFQLDIRIDKKIIFKKWILSAYIDFYNIGHFLYKSPQMVISNSDYPFDELLDVPVEVPVYQYSIFSIGLKGEF